MASSTTNTPSEQSNDTPTFIDIGANLLDSMYQGDYRGKERHIPDLHQSVLPRAWNSNLERIIITGGTLSESQEGLKLSQTDERLFCTVGVHPTRCSSEFGETESSWEEYLKEMKNVIEEGINLGKVVAMGELGLDYARLQFCDVKTQKRGFIAQLQVAKEMNLPLFLHNRETGTDLLEILKEHYYNPTENDDNKPLKGGVVHSFDDTIELANQFLDLGLYIGINGCSLKTTENLEVVRQLPLNRLLLETDCPWCDIRQSHAGFSHVETKFMTKTEKKYEEGCCVKGRYEPCHIVQVAEVVAGVMGVSVEEVANASRKNAYDLFGLGTTEDQQQQE